MSLIVEHPDVQRDLLRMKSLNAAARAIAYCCAHATDMSRRGPQETRGGWADRASLLTPIAKAFSTDVGVEVASLGIQVHGGTGYIEETGAAQDLRDARIFPIYEGTNGIQAIDLVMRKLRLDDGKPVKKLIGEFVKIAKEVAALNRSDFGHMGERLVAATADLAATTEFLLGALAEKKTADALAAATPYLRLFGLTAGGMFLAKGALYAANRDDGAGWIALARFFAESMVGETAALAGTVTESADGLRKAAAAHLQPTGSSA
jgi:hypothetical protein